MTAETHTAEPPSKDLWVNTQLPVRPDMPLDEPLTPATLFARLSELKDLQSAGLPLYPVLPTISEDPSAASTNATDTAGEDEEEEKEKAEGGEGSQDSAHLVSIPPPMSTNAVERIQDVVLRISHTVRVSLDTLGDDLSRYLSGGEFATSALAKLRVPADSYLVVALKNQVQWVVEAEVVRELQLRYAQTKELVVEGIARDVRQVLDRADLLGGDMDELEEKWDGVAAAIEAYVISRITLVMDTMNLWVTETIPGLIRSLVDAWVIGEGALLRPIYDRVTEGLLPVVKGIIDTVIEGMRQRREAFESTVIVRVREDLSGIRGHFRL